MKTGRYNKPIAVFIYLLLFITLSYSQTEQDCLGAIPICSTYHITVGPIGNGAIPDGWAGKSNCITGEKNSTWFLFQIDGKSAAGALAGFTITPDDLTKGGADYDFAVFGPNMPCFSLKDPIRCSAAPANCAYCPPTGVANFAVPPNSEDKTGKNLGDGFVPALVTQPGESYYIIVNNYSSSTQGFVISLTGMATYNCDPEPPCQLVLNLPNDVTMCQAATYSFQITPDYGPPGYTIGWNWGANPPEAESFLSDINSEKPIVTIPDNFSGEISFTLAASILWPTFPPEVYCTSVKTIKVNVLPAPDLTIEAIPEMCESGKPVKVNVSPLGGKIEAFGPIINGIIDPSVWGPGNTPLTYTYTYPNGCVRTNSIDVLIVEGPVADIEDISELCITDSIVTLIGYDYGGKWGGAANSKGEIDPKKLGVGTHNVTYTVTDGTCTNSASISVEVKPLPDVNIKDPGPICTNQPIVSLIYSPNGKGGTWVGIPDTAGKFSPPAVGAGLYNVIYKFKDIFGCKNADTIKIKINDPPFAILPNTMQVCNTTSNNNISTLNFTSLISGGDKNGVWTDINGSGASGSFPTLDFNNVTPGFYVFHYATNSAKLPCPEANYDITVEVINCKCPSVILSPSSQLCSDNGLIDLESLKQNNNAGTWSISSSPAGSKPAIIQGASNFTTNGSDPGNYVITFSLNNPPPAGCPETNTTTITVNPKPKATIKPNSLVCNKLIAGNGPTTLDFTSLITSGDKSGTWLDVSGSGASGSFPTLDFTGVAPGNYSFSYTTNSAQAPCTESSYTISVTVQNCECPSVDLVPNVADLCNDNVASIDLDQYKITTEAGNWSIKSKPVGANPASIVGKTFSINGKDGGTYILTFTLATPPPVGCPASSDLTININPAPSAVVTSTAKICNSPASGNGTTINFSSLITSGDKSGTWIDVNGSGASGNFPVKDFNGLIPGNYTFTYSTNSASFPCTDKSYSVVVTVENCDCPSLALTSYTALCNGGNSSINLNTLKITTENGNWSVKKNAPGPNPATLAGANFDANGANTGIYVLTFTLAPPPPVGCLKSADLTIEVLPKPFASLTTSAKVCNSAGSGQYTTSLNLYSLITAGDKSGSWLDVNNSGASGPNNNLDFTGVKPGNYTFTYTTNSATAPCTEASYQVTITVEDCECPSIATKNPGDLCSSSADINLLNLKLTTENGVWTVTSTPIGSNPGTINANTFTGTNADPGSYTLTFTLATAPPQGCPNSSTQTFNIAQALSAGLAAAPAEFCENAGAQVNLASLLSGNDPGGLWKEISSVPSQGNANNILNGFFNAQNQKPGIYTIQYTVVAQSPCPSDQSQVQIIINQLPVSDAGNDQVITCAQLLANLGGSNTTAGPNIVYSWTGGIVANVNAAATNTNSPGTYTLNVENTKTGCKSSDQVVVTGGDDIPTPVNLLIDSISCFGESDGKIQFDKIKGGTAPYEVFINGISYGKAQYFNRLPPGTYQMKIVDASGCSFIQNLVLTQPDEIYVDLGADVTVELGDSLRIDPFINIPKNQIDTLVWSPIIHNLCDGCLKPLIYPYFTTPLKLELIDKNGCRASDEMYIFVDVARKVFFPNIFSPNDDALNDRFYPFAGSFVSNIDEFKIYDRWGDLIFEQYNFQPNDYDKGWDGTRNGQRLNTTVYVYYAVVKFKDGKKKVFKGDVLLKN